MKAEQGDSAMDTNAKSAPTQTTYEDLCLYINGQFIKGGGRKESDVVNPATDEVIGKLPHAGQADLDLALISAQKAFQTWRKTSPIERSRVLRKVAELSRARAQEIGHNITMDMGKPLAEAAGEVTVCSEHADWAAEECRRIYGRVIPARSEGVRQFVLKEPIGVVAAFSPWNCPYNQAIRKIVSALGAGCTIIIKGPEDAPSAVIAIARLFHEAGLPPGCLNVVWGVPSEVSTYLINSPIVRKISFTGSVPVGKQLAAMAGSLMKPCTMELGGHSPVIVMDDADIEGAADIMAGSKFRNAGQVCVSPTRFYVQRGIYDAFVKGFAERTANVKVGNGLEDGTRMGPLANARRPDAIEALVNDAKSKGARVLAGGERGESGFFFQPTLLADVPNEANIMNDEPFGPVAVSRPFDTFEEVIEQANRLPYGLAAFAFTENGRRANLIGELVESGMVGINTFAISGADTPFGGVKDSGFGSEGGKEGLESYQVVKAIHQA
jgi:succinate-semialdehyde dehydrogenase/glutarate-semialdehyde dehydrogenase